MNPEPNDQHWSSEAGVREDLQSQPHLFMKMPSLSLRTLVGPDSC